MEGKQQDGKLLPCIFWLLCSTPELDNYTPNSTQLLFSFLFHGHIKLQIPSSHTERAVTRGTAEQKTVGGLYDTENFWQRLLLKHDLSWQNQQSNISTLWTAVPASQLAEGMFPHSDS